MEYINWQGLQGDHSLLSIPSDLNFTLPNSTIWVFFYIAPIISYLTAHPSRDIITAARQALTRQWWNEKRFDYELYISEFVISEAAAGDSEMATRRLEVLAGITEIELSEMAAEFAEVLIEEGPLPQKATLDALHIAVAVSGGIEYLLTWNFAHLANATIRNQIERKCRLKGYEPPIICTPEELLGE